MRAIVLGAGMVGRVMAADLAEDAGFDVAIADLSEGALAAASRHADGRIQTIRGDLADRAVLAATIEPYDIVLGALASPIGFQSLRTVIECRKNYCDISFMPQDAWELDDLARERDVTAVVDCGVAPGMSNMLAGLGASRLDACERIEIYVGGLPRERKWPFSYKAAFSPADVLEEYTRPARLVENATIVRREALSEPELIDFGGIGTLEAFNTDGLRSLAYTMGVPFMKEKTLRYPGHIELMRVFRETGLFSHDPIQIGHAQVRPVDLLSALMFPMWSYEDGEQDLTVMRVTAEGLRDGHHVRLAWDLLDYYDPETNRTSMSRTTAFPCAIMARVVARGQYTRRGVVTMEMIGDDETIVRHVLKEHSDRGVEYTASEGPARAATTCP